VLQGRKLAHLSPAELAPEAQSLFSSHVHWSRSGLRQRTRLHRGRSLNLRSRSRAGESSACD
jgi:hypothetical protein